MRRLMVIAAFGLLLAVPVWAQHGGGGHGGGGGHADFGGGHASFGGGHAGFGGHSGFGGAHYGGSGPAVHSFSGVRSAAGFSRSFSPSARSGFSRGPFLHNGFRGRNGFGHHGRPGWGFRNNCRGYGCWGGYGYPWYGVGYYDPWLWDWWNSDSSYDQDYNDNLALANEMNQQSLEQQQMWRQEQADGDQDAYTPRSNPARPAPSGSNQQPPADPPSPIIPATVLVFRDQHQQEIQNYAIVGQTLWNFAPQRTQKIPLSELDLAATQKANDDRGVTFRLPIGSEGQ
jgi:hypothetical protein